MDEFFHGGVIKKQTNKTKFHKKARQMNTPERRCICRKGVEPYLVGDEAFAPKVILLSHLQKPPHMKQNLDGKNLSSQRSDCAIAEQFHLNIFNYWKDVQLNYLSSNYWVWFYSIDLFVLFSSVCSWFYSLFRMFSTLILNCVRFRLRRNLNYVILWIYGTYLYIYGLI